MTQQVFVMNANEARTCGYYLAVTWTSPSFGEPEPFEAQIPLLFT